MKTPAPLPHTDIRDLSESETQGAAMPVDVPALVDEMRSSAQGIAQMALFLASDDNHAVHQDKGVGARHRPAPPSAGGGGYQNNCEIFETRQGEKKSVDPRLEELAIMGLAEYWLQVADYLGFDAFLGMWRILDANKDRMRLDKGGNGGNSMMPTLRPYAGYLRFQKNRFVENLAAQGIKSKEIQRRVKLQLCENISIVHINRLANKNKIRR